MWTPPLPDPGESKQKTSLKQKSIGNEAALILLLMQQLILLVKSF